MKALRKSLTVMLPWALVFPLLAAPVAAQQIAGVAGTLTYGATVTLTGTGFGDREINNNLIFDNLESGVFNNRWSSTTQLSIVNQSRHANSQKAGYHNFTNWEKHGYFTGGANDPGPWFCQYWFKLGANFDWGTGLVENQPGATLSNVKFFRMWESGASYENFSMAVAGWEGRAAAAVEYTNNQRPDFMQSGYMQTWTKEVWHNFQFEFKDSSALGAHDGVIRWWIDGQLVYENTGWMTREDETPFKRPYILGFYDSWEDSYADNNDFYIDDAYVADSWARVELGNAPTYSACTHREIQVPTSWSASQVSFAFNSGSFQPGTTAYLFAVNPNGTPSAGYPVTIGGTLQAPGKPGQPHF